MVTVSTQLFYVRGVQRWYQGKMAMARNSLGIYGQGCLILARRLPWVAVSAVGYAG